MGAEAIVALALQLGPTLVQAAMQLYQTAAAAAETPAEIKAHFASIALALEQTNTLVQNTPEPPEGSGA